ncbi:transglutaminase domain-containing protein [Chloroflexota bacterium]
MKRIIIVGVMLVLLTALSVSSYAWATPSTRFQEVDDELFDQWQICRTRSTGENGFYQLTSRSFRPVIAFESLGEESDLAYRLGEQIGSEYPDRNQRAEAIFRFVRNRIIYATDRDQFKYDEFAQNADELASVIEQDGAGHGDCEDSAVLLAVMFKGAGYRSAIAVGSEHTAALVYLPDYNRASAVFELDGDKGWVWAEATGKNNPLGWVPKEFVNAKLAAYEIGEEAISLAEPSLAPSIAVARTGKTSASQPFPFLSIIGLLFFLSLFRRRRRVR